MKAPHDYFYTHVYKKDMTGLSPKEILLVFEELTYWHGSLTTHRSYELNEVNLLVISFNSSRFRNDFNKEIKDKFEGITANTERPTKPKKEKTSLTEED